MGTDNTFELPYDMNNSDLLFAKLLGRTVKEDSTLPEMKEQDEKKISPELYLPQSAITPNENDHKKRNLDFSMWHSVGPVDISSKLVDSNNIVLRTHSQQYLDAKVDMVNSALCHYGDKEEMAKKFLAMSSSLESCVIIRQLGYMPLLVQLIHNAEESASVHNNASQALHNIVHHNPDDKRGRRETRVLKIIDQLIEYCDDTILNESDNMRDNHPGSIIALLMKLSFDEEHRHAMSQLGALHVIAKLIQRDHELHSANDVSNINPECITLRRYAMMALTNLTFGDGKSKALLCSLKPFLSSLISQLNSPNEELCQVTANVLRNLSWRADTTSKQTLREFGAVTILMKTALRVKNESTLKAVLSALWNFSAHCNLNKIDICNVDGAIEYLVHMLMYQAPSKTLLVVENAGGILRNISSIIAVREDYRCILRNNNCLPILVHQLKSPSLTVVSNACGTLWNLSARNVTDQRSLWQLGAVPMLRSLKHSKHRMISMGSAAALKNLLSSRPDCELSDKSNKPLPTLLARKRRTLEQELDPSLSETCDNLEQIESWDSFSLSSNDGGNKTDNSTSSASVQYLNNSENINKPGKDDVPFSSRLEDEIEGSSKVCLECEQTELKSVANCNDIDGVNDIREDNVKLRNVENCTQMFHNLNINSIENKTSYSDKDMLVTYDDGETEDVKAGYRKIEEPYNEDEVYTNYAETDLDQPTNYSLQDVEHDTIQTYCTEGTPYNFSSSNSMLDLHQVITGDIKTAEEIQSPLCFSPSVIHTPSKDENGKESKNVTFDTPLMFSRSSSIGSLSSVEQHDDHGSVVSEFSRMPSGMISPSELPDSPTQTVPPSPKMERTREIPITDAEGGIFEDCIKVFKDESTPFQFSTATSLSSLTFDDDVHIDTAGHLPTVKEVSPEQVTALQTDNAVTIGGKVCYVTPSVRHVVTTNNVSNTISCNSSGSLENNNFEKHDCTLDDELSLEEQQAMLDACIKSAMPEKPKKSETFRKTSKGTLISHANTSDSNSLTCNSRSSSFKTASQKLKYSPTNSISDDTTVNFCTEDTPASISHAASNSDLSILCPSEDSFLRDSILPLSSCNDEVELTLDEQQKLLRECISTGLKTLNAVDLNLESEYHIQTKPSLLEVTEELPVDEQKLLLKKCILAGINNVTMSMSKIQKASSIVNGDLTEDEQKMLLKQCIALGIRNIKDVSCCDLENVGPPSFLAEANLENSLTNVDSIVSEVADSPTVSIIDDITLVEDNINSSLDDGINNDETIVERHKLQQKRKQIKDRYCTYTINSENQNSKSSNKMMDNIKSIMERPRKSFMIKERRSANKDRFKTRTLNECDFNQLASYEMSKYNRNSDVHLTEGEENGRVTAVNLVSSIPNSGTNSDTEVEDDQTIPKAKVVKPISIQPMKNTQKVKSGIPIINKPKIPQITNPTKSKIPTKLPASLQRQSTFTKEEISAIPAPVITSPTKKNVSLQQNYKIDDVPRRNFPPSKIELVKNTKLRSSYSGVRNDFVQNRWSVSDNSINTVSSFKSTSNGNLNMSAASITKPTSSQPKKEVTSKIASLWKRTRKS